MEIELKLALDPAERKKLARLPLLSQLAVGAPRRAELHAIYYDTPDLFLRRHDIGLRVRRIGPRWIQTMKAGGGVQGGLHQRHEWECEVGGEQPDLEQLRAQLAGSPWAGAMATPGLAQALQALFTVRVERQTWDLQLEDGAIEMVADHGLIERAGSSLPVCEIELELKAGRPQLLYRFALQLQEKLRLRLDNRSKAERGYALGAETAAGAVKAIVPALQEGQDVLAGLQLVIGSCLEQVQANEAGVIEGHDPEPLHQMRVGLRRLRSALRLFHPAAPCPPQLLDEIAWLGGVLGAARDWDVLGSATLARLPADRLDPALAGYVHASAAERRQEAARALLAPRYTRLLLSLHAWLLGLEETAAGAAGAAGMLHQPLPAYAASAVRHGRRRLRRRGRKMETADAAALHRLRIAAKRLRYAMEFFQALYPGRRARRYVAALAALQDELGWRNDIAVADALLLQLQEQEPGLATAAAFARGYLQAQLHGAGHALPRVWKKIRRAKPPRSQRRRKK